MILFDWQCSCGALFEAFERTGEKPECPKCHSADSATKLISAPRIDPKLGVDAAGFPTMGEKWTRRRKQHQRIEEARKRDNGD